MRDYQRRSHQWLQGEAWDACTPLGPALTIDEVSDIRRLDQRLELNGQEMQHTSTERLIFGVEAMIAWISEFTTVKPGDAILTGTRPASARDATRRYFFNRETLWVLRSQRSGFRRPPITAAR